MIKNGIKLVFCLLAITSYSQDSITRIKEYYPNSDKLKSEHGVLNDLVHGTYIYYSENGIIIGTANYKSGKLDGLLTTYSSSGIIQNTAEYVEGLINGMQIIYNTDGSVHEIAYYKNNLRHGFSTMFYESGEIGNVTNYFEGQKQGVDKHFYKNGSIKKILSYNEFGLIDGITKEFDEYGNIIRETVYRGGEKME